MKLRSLIPLLLLPFGPAVALDASTRETNQPVAKAASSHPALAIRTWDFEAGLPHGSINSMARTADGYLWLGASSGLVRFDGLRFVLYAPKEIPEMGADGIVGVVVDSVGELWAADRGGTIIHRVGNQFNTFKIQLPRGTSAIQTFARETNGTVWLADDHNVFRYRPAQRKAETVNQGLPADLAYRQGQSTVGSDMRIVCDSKGRIWASAARQVYIWESERWQSPRGIEAIRWPVHAFCESRDGGMWIGTIGSYPMLDRGTRVYKFLNGKVECELGPYPWDQSSIRTRVVAIREDSQGRVWIGTHGAGVYFWSDETGWQRLCSDGPLAQLFIGTMEVGSEQSLWIATQPSGLHRVKERVVETYRLPATADTSISTAHVARDGTVWVGTYDAGVFQLRDGHFIQRTNGLLNLQVGVIFEDSRTNLWVGTWDGLHRWDGKAFLAITNPPQLTSVVRAMAEDANGDLWITTNEGLVRRRDSVTKVFWEEEGIDHLYLHAVTTDPDGRAWLAVTDRGLYRQNGGRFEMLGEKDWAAAPFIRALHADKQGALWIATWGWGLYCLQPSPSPPSPTGGEVRGLERGEGQISEGTFRHWDTSDGLPDNTLHSITEDADENLWISSDSGIFGCSKAALLAHYPRRGEPLLCWRITTADGLETGVCEGAGQPMVGRSADGRFWVPNQRSLAVFDPRQIAQVTRVLPALIEEVRVDGITRMTADSALAISSASRRIEFHYSSPNLQVPERLRFRSRLSGLEESWVDAGGDRAAIYSHLQPGDYEFQVMVGGPDGQWREARHGLKLTIVPRLWERRSVQIFGATMVLLIVSTTVWAVGRARLHRRLERIQLQQTLEAERRRIARDLHDDLGANLAEILYLGEEAERAAIPNEAKEHSDRLTTKVRQTISAMDQIVWTVNPENDSITNLAGFLSEYAQEFFQPTTIRCRLEVMTGLPNWTVTAAARHNVFLAVKEAMHNVAKHSDASEVCLRIRCHDQKLEIDVEDNGHGFDVANGAYSGDGLGNMRLRLAEIGGHLEIRSQPSRGTRVLFALPIEESQPSIARPDTSSSHS